MKVISPPTNLQPKIIMKPFDLDKALAGEPVVTRAGEKVEKIVHNPDAKEFFRVAFWVDGIVWGCDESGYVNSGKHGHDLFMAPKEIVKWINIYVKKGEAYKFVPSHFYSSESEAKNDVKPNWALDYVCTSIIKITL
jgi:hypothetical protein